MSRDIRWLAVGVGLTVAVVLSLTIGGARAQSADLPSQMQAVVRSVNADQLTIELEDGSQVVAATREQIDDVRAGAKLNFLYRVNGTTKQLVRILAVTD